MSINPQNAINSCLGQIQSDMTNLIENDCGEITNQESEALGFGTSIQDTSELSPVSNALPMGAELSSLDNVFQGLEQSMQQALGGIGSASSGDGSLLSDVGSFLGNIV